MKLPRPPQQYDTQDQAQTRALAERADLQNLKRGQDIDMGAARLILAAPNGTRYALTVSNTGIVSATPV